MLTVIMAAHEACAGIGAVDGKGLAAAIKANYSRQVFYAAVALVGAVKTINIGADIGALAAAARLLISV